LLGLVRWVFWGESIGFRGNIGCWTYHCERRLDS
jgi:hypothetical protein